MTEPDGAQAADSGQVTDPGGVPAPGAGAPTPGGGVPVRAWERRLEGLDALAEAAAGEGAEADEAAERLTSGVESLLTELESSLEEL
ncbi:hypothetical protein [Brevibacterium salitolerans]|uniref:Uncharacterized protein n=1 Tax=Brevibacterium salitolerans TaxID=1403566 RepID=A0ABN2XA55_9MICO